MEGENLDNISAADGKYTFVLNFHRLYETRAEESRESRECIIVVK